MGIWCNNATIYGKEGLCKFLMRVVISSNKMSGAGAESLKKWEAKVECR
jgi:hypothetical protein